MSRLLLGLVVMGFAVGPQQEPVSESQNPMHRFKPFVGKWHTQETVRTFPTAKPETRELRSNIYFIAGETVLVVDETSIDGSYRFIGFHRYDAAKKKYVNWGASSTALGPPPGWQEGEFDATGRAITWVWASGPDMPSIRGVWRLDGPDRHEYTSYQIGPNGEEYVRKNDVYIRKQ